MKNVVMKPLKVLPLLLAMGMSSLAWAGESVDRTLDVKSRSHVDITHVTGEVKVSVWDESKVRVVGELHERARELIFDRKGSKVVVKVKMPKRGRNYGDSERGDRLEVFVPKDVKVSYDSVNGDFTGSGFSGGADLESVNGDILVSDLNGRLNIETVNGDIRTQDLQGSVELETVNGNIRDIQSNGPKAQYNTVNGDIQASSGIQDIEVETVNGDVELELEKVSELQLTSVNGSTEASLNLMDNGVVKGSSVGGAITLKLQSDVSARFEVQAHAGGRIVNDISNDKVNKPKYGPGRWLDFSQRGGSAQVKVSTVHGSVRLETHE